MSATRERWLLLGVALAVRLVLAWVFFGSIDVINSVFNARRLIAGQVPSQLPLPYFTGIDLFLWTGGMLIAQTALPLGFCFKVFAALFDGAAALAVHDLAGRRAGWLYALAPIPIIIGVLHGQWDNISFAFFLAALALVRTRTVAGSFTAGALALLSIAIKPVLLPFLPFLVDAPWRARRTFLAAVSGFAAALGLYALVLRLIGDPLNWTSIATVIWYARTGTYVLNAPVMIGEGANRLVALLPLLVLLPLYWSGRIARERAIALQLLLLVGLTQLTPQNLIWPVALLLICRNWRFAALYTFVGGTFLVLYYDHPGWRSANVSNLGVLAPLRELAWLAPQTAFLEIKGYVLIALGFVLVPLLCVAFVAREAMRTRNERDSDTTLARTPSQLMQPLLVVLVLTAAIIGYAFTLPRTTPERYMAAAERKMHDYHLVRFIDPPLVPASEWVWLVPAFAGRDPGGFRPHAVVLGLVWVGAWSVVAWRTRDGS